MRIATPEGVELELALAGLGSRAVAGSVDIVLKVVLIAALAILLFVAAGGTGVAAAVFTAAAFAVYFGYDVVFEVLAAGRTRASASADCGWWPRAAGRWDSGAAPSATSSG